MKDLRPVYYHECIERLVSNRLAVYDEILSAGPSTGSELSSIMGWPVTSVRPRLTELRESFWVFETGIRRKGEHEFSARTPNQVKDYLQMIHDQTASLQLQADEALQDDLHLSELVEIEQKQMQQELFT